MLQCTLSLKKNQPNPLWGSRKQKYFPFQSQSHFWVTMKKQSSDWQSQVWLWASAALRGQQPRTGFSPSSFGTQKVSRLVWPVMSLLIRESLQGNLPSADTDSASKDLRTSPFRESVGFLVIHGHPSHVGGRDQRAVLWGKCSSRRHPYSSVSFFLF